MRTAALFTSVLALSPLAAAWSQGSDSNAVQHIEEALVPRQDNNNDNQSSNAPASSTQNQASNTITAPPQSSGSGASSAAASSGASNASSGGSSAASSGGSGSQSATAAPSSSLSPIDAQDPAGGAAMITPAATLGAPYYKVDETITWVWNYTSLARNPAAIDILASFQPTNGVSPTPFTLALNETFEATQTFKWDTGKYTSATGPLPIGTYTLVIYDADAPGGVSATASPGHLGVWEQFSFGMYTKQASTLDVTYAEIVCATCNSANGLQKMTIGALLATAGITVATFSWFTGGFAALW